MSDEKSNLHGFIMLPLIPCNVSFVAAPSMFRSVAGAQATLKVTREVKDVAVRAGESAMFECHITGPPDVDVDWLSNGKLIQPALLNCKMHFDGKRWVLFVDCLSSFCELFCLMVNKYT